MLVFVEVKRQHCVTHPEIRHSSRDKMYQNAWISREARELKGGKEGEGVEGRGRGLNNCGLVLGFLDCWRCAI